MAEKTGKRKFFFLFYIKFEFCFRDEQSQILIKQIKEF